MNTTTSPPRRSTGAVVAALLLFFPLGLYWMWRNRTWSSGLRWTVTAFASIVLLIAAFSSPPKPTVASNQATASNQTATQTPSPSPTAAEPTAATTVAPAPAKVAAAAARPAAKPVVVAKAAPSPVAPPPTHVAAPVTVAAPPPPATNLCGAPSNPYGYNYCGRGSNIYSPPADICNYFSCINNFSNGKGYMAECNDTMVSMSGGRQGACSYHSGELRAVTG